MMTASNQAAEGVYIYYYAETKGNEVPRYLADAKVLSLGSKLKVHIPRIGYWITKVAK